MLAAGALPLHYVGFSTCFRREAGAGGKDTRGIFRVHQFDKLELFSYCHPDRSWDEQEELLAIEDQDDFVTRTTASLGPQPPNFENIVALNQGPLRNGIAVRTRGRPGSARSAPA